jgi:broad specificity phosphatase PhoE
MLEAPPGGESASEFHQRVADTFDRLVERHQGLNGHLVVVTHGLVIHRLLKSHLHLGLQHILPERLGNTSVTAASGEVPFEVQLLDCTLHLEEFFQDDALSLSGG